MSSVAKQPALPTPAPPHSGWARARSVFLVAALVHLSAIASMHLGYRDPALSLLWLPGPLVMAIMLARGGWTPVAAAIGMVSWSVASQHSLPVAAGHLAASVAMPVVAAMTMNVWFRLRPTPSNLVVTIRMLGTIVLVLAPLAALADAFGQGIMMRAHVDIFEAWLGYFAIQAMSGIVLVRAFLSLMPDVPGAVCPIVDGMNAVARFRPVELVSHAVICAVGTLAWMLATNGFAWPSLLLLSSVFIVPVATALLLERQAASRTLILTVASVVGLRAASSPFDHSTDYLLTMTQMIVLLILCGIALHLLNAATAERNEHRLRLERLAFTSEQTGLPNRHALVQAIEERLRRTPPQPFRLAELAVPELANGPALNGIDSCTEIERRVAELLQDRFPQAEMIAHAGTGCFVLLLPACVDDATLRGAIAMGMGDPLLALDAVAQRLRCAMGVIDGGVACDGEQSNTGELLIAASIARQQAWVRPDRFCSIGAHERTMHHHRERLRHLGMTRRALDAGRLRLLGQPILPCHGRPERLHYEVLARLIDEDGTEISPAIFLPALAGERMLEEFDRTVLETTLRTLSQDPALRAITGLAAINITGPTLADPAFPPFLRGLLGQYRIDPAIVSLEVTESDSIANLESARRNVSELNKAGIAIAVDDFGTGFATFDYLRKFTPQWLKIDGSFVREFDDAPLSREIIASIVRVAHAVGARTVAESVENMSIARRMTELGVDALQGWALGRPMPLADLANYDATVIARASEQQTERQIEPQIG